MRGNLVQSKTIEEGGTQASLRQVSYFPETKFLFSLLTIPFLSSRDPFHHLAPPIFIFAANQVTTKLTDVTQCCEKKNPGVRPTS